MEKSKIGRSNKRRGNDAERKYAKSFRDLGFERCKTSRSESRNLDNAKVDLTDIPFNVQIKAGFKKGINYSGLLKEVEDALSEAYPERLSLPTMIIHEKPVGKGKKRTKYNTLVILTFEDFKKLLK